MIPKTSLEALRLRNLGYAPWKPTSDGREFISYPYPLDGGAGYGIAVREVGDPTTITHERIPDEALDYLWQDERGEA